MTKSSGATIMRIGINKGIIFLLFIIVLTIIPSQALTQITPFNVTDANTNDNNLATKPPRISWDIPYYYYSDFNFTADSFHYSFYVGGYYSTPSVEAYNYSNSQYEIIATASTLYPPSNTEIWLNGSLSSQYISSVIKLKAKQIYIVTTGSWYIYEIQGNYDNLPSVPQISFPSNNSRHYNNSINYTWNQSTDVDGDTLTYHHQLSTLLNFSTIFNQSNVTNNWTGSITGLTDGVTYYGKVRSYDGYEYSNWSNTTQFTENSLPSISDPDFLRPSSPTGTTNLTLSLNITTDPEGDTITNHTLWYINNVLNTSYNNSLFLNYSNFTTGDSIYVKAYLRDGYENTSLTTSNSVIIGSQNSAPVLSSITLNPNIRKYNKSVWVNSSNITDSESSYIRLLTYYKLTNESKVYLNNSSWYAPPTTINVTFNSPWNDSNSHYIYAQVEDSGNISGFYNLTSGEVQATLTGDTTAPTVFGSSLSASSIYTGSHVTVNMTTSLSNGTTSNVSVHISRPDATSADYVMTTTNNTLWSYVYTSTSNLGSYYIEYFSMTDDSGNRGTETSALTFVASTAPAPSSGGGGGGSSTIVIVKETNGSQEVLFTNITSSESLKDLNTLGLCFSTNLMLTNKCSQSSISIVDEPLNWWVLFGAYLGSMITLFIISIATDTKKKFAENILFYGSVSWVSVILLTFMGLNLYIFNYIFNSALPGFMFLSFFGWGVVTTFIGDSYSKIYKK